MLRLCLSSGRVLGLPVDYGGGVARDGATKQVTWTRRQRQVLELVARGHTNPEIAEKLGISLDGAKWHVSEVISKLGVRSREEAADYWLAQRRADRAPRWLRRLFVPLVLAGGGAALAVVGLAIILSLANEPGQFGGAPMATPARAPSATAQPRGTFAAVGDMAVPRSIHAAATLKDGRLLVMGGSVVTGQPPVKASVEIYDPQARTFAPGPDLLEARQTFAAVTLRDGRVLVSGGVAISGLLKSAELYNPAPNTFTPAGPMTEPRANHAMALLPDGRVLIVGSGWKPASSTEVFNPGTNAFTRGPAMSLPRQGPRVATLADGSILVVSGGTAERYDVASGRFVLVNDSGTLPEVPSVLQDGRVLLTGGPDLDFERAAPTLPPGPGHGVPLPAIRAAVLLDMRTGTTTSVGQMGTARMLHQAVTLRDGRVLIAGGVSDSQFGEFISSAEIFDPATDAFTSTAKMADGRVWFTLSMLANGAVLVVGVNGQPFHSAAEVYVP